METTWRNDLAGSGAVLRMWLSVLVAGIWNFDLVIPELRITEDQGVTCGPWHVFWRRSGWHEPA